MLPDPLLLTTAASCAAGEFAQILHTLFSPINMPNLVRQDCLFGGLRRLTVLSSLTSFSPFA